jgi:hypothetical protein
VFASEHGKEFLSKMLNSPLAEGLLGAVIGAVIAGLFILYQTKTMLSTERRRREDERESETKSLAAALLWEIDCFYKLSIRDVCRGLKTTKPSDLALDAKSATLTVFEANAGKVGLFEPRLIQAVIGYYGNARAYLDTMSDYGDAKGQYFQGGLQTVLRQRAIAFLEQIQKSSQEMVPPTRTVCELLAARAGTDYKFDAP